MKKFALTKSKIRDSIPFAIFFLSFASEIVHGILTHELGTSDYAPLSVGEIVRGSLFLLAVGYAILTVRHQSSRVVLIALMGLFLWVCVQDLVFQLTISEMVNTLLRGVRWLYLFFMLNWLTQYIRRYRLSPGAVISQIKWLILLFYCVPILLSAAGIAGYTVYGADSSRQGFGGFVMNSNVVASMLLFMLPFYLRLDHFRDWIMLLLYVGAAVLLGSKLTWIGFAGVLGGWLAWKMLRGFGQTLIRSGVLRIKQSAVWTFVLSVAVILILPFTPIVRIVTGIYQGLVDLYLFYVVGNAFGYNFNMLDLLTSGRTLRISQLLEWARQPGNGIMLLIGGGIPNYERLYGEVDWVDLTALFGILGVVLFYSIIFLFLWNIFISRRPFRQEIFWMLSLTIAISLTSGHTYDGPAVGTVIAGVLAAFWGQKSQLFDRLQLGKPETLLPITSEGDGVEKVETKAQRCNGAKSRLV